MKILSDLNFTAFIVFSILMSLFFFSRAHADEVKTLYLDDKTIGRIAVSPKGTVITFPTKPSNTVLGSEKSFAPVYMGSDLVVSPLSQSARTYVFVYVLGRRYTLELFTTLSNGNAIVEIKDKAALPIQGPKKQK